VIVNHDGDPCPRCREPTQVREYSHTDEKPSHQFFTCWFCCMKESVQDEANNLRSIQGGVAAGVKRADQGGN